MTDAALASSGKWHSRAASHGSEDAFGRAMMIPVLATVLAAPIPLASNRPFFWAFWAAVISSLFLMWCIFGERHAFAWRTLPGVRKAMFLLAAAYGCFVFVQVLPLGLITGPFVFMGAAGETFNSISLSLAPGDTWLALLRWWSYCALFLIVAELAARPSLARFMQGSVAIIVGIHALWGLLALHVLGDTVLFMPKWAYEGLATGTFVNRNSFATFLGLGAVSVMAIVAGQLSGKGTRPARLALAAAMYGAPVADHGLPVPDPIADGHSRNNGRHGGDTAVLHAPASANPHCPFGGAGPGCRPLHDGR